MDKIINESQLFVGRPDKFDPTLVTPITRNASRAVVSKPRFGLWTSTTQFIEPPLNYDMKMISGWIVWCATEQPSFLPINDGILSCTLFRMKENVKVWDISTQRDLEQTRWVEGNECGFKTYSIDCEYYIKNGYSGIHTNGSPEVCGASVKEPDLYGWDCESTVWFNLDVFEDWNDYNLILPNGMDTLHEYVNTFYERYVYYE